MSTFCAAPLRPIWRNDGLSPCFVDLIASTAIILWALLVATPAGVVALYRSNRSGRQRSGKLSLLTALTLLVLPSSAIALFIVRSANSAGFVGVDLLRAVSGVASAWLVFAPILKVHTITSQSGAVGYSVLFLLYQCAKLTSWNSPEWFGSFAEWLLFAIEFLSAWLVLLLSLWLSSQTRAWGVADADVESAEPILGSKKVEGATNTPIPTTGSVYSGIGKKIRFVYPYVWPRKSLALQARVVFCVFLIAAGRVVNPMVPLYSKKIIDALTVGSFPLQLIVIYVFFKFLQGGSGVLNNLRTFLWILVTQYTSRELTLDFFGHLHNLTLQFHLGRRTGEILRILDRATSSINQLLRIVGFQIVPTVADILIAIVFFVSQFSVWFGLLVTVAMLLYLAATILVTEWRAKFQRRTNLADNETRTIGVDSLLNFETVKYYNAERYEINRYREKYVAYQTHEWYALASWTLLNTIQNIITNAGLFIGSLYAAYLVSIGQYTVGDYVLFGTYLTQLYGPLSMFGAFYRQLQQGLIDMENMMDLFQVENDVPDAPNAIDLPGSATDCVSEIRFDNVHFSYIPERPILRGVSFTVPPGKTFALVGPTGSGKSTVIRLLFRFYDVTQGAVLFDGHDVRQLTQKSLRQSIGVVPQDTVLFNTSIRDNIRYGRVDATDSEVEAAAVAADIHDRILHFPQGYETVVGERGLKLSGGEKQRVCIARTILKNPRLVLLDEATSALDTRTERFIQASLAEISAGRTTLVVAHRLSTIVNADRILVMRDGEIVEQGSHQELLSAYPDGQYATLWSEQQREGSPTDMTEISEEPAVVTGPGRGRGRGGRQERGGRGERRGRGQRSPESNSPDLVR